MAYGRRKKKDEDLGNDYRLNCVHAIRGEPIARNQAKVRAKGIPSEPFQVNVTRAATQITSQETAMTAATTRGFGG